MSTPILDADPRIEALWRKLLALNEWPAHAECENDPAVACSVFQMIAEHLQVSEPTPIQRTLTEWVRNEIKPTHGKFAIIANLGRINRNGDILSENGSTYRVVLERVG